MLGGVKDEDVDVDVTGERRRIAIITGANG